MSIPKKLRSNLRGDRNRMQAQGMTIIEDRFEDFKTLVALNTAAFEDSPFHEQRLVSVCETIVAVGRGSAPYRSRMLTAEVGGKIAAVDCMFLFGSTCYDMLCGSDTGSFSGVGNAMQLQDIDDAIRQGMTVVDFAEADYDAPKLKLYPARKQYVYERA